MELVNSGIPIKFPRKLSLSYYFFCFCSIVIYSLHRGAHPTDDLAFSFLFLFYWSSLCYMLHGQLGLNLFWNRLQRTWSFGPSAQNTPYLHRMWRLFPMQCRMIIGSNTLSMTFLSGVLNTSPSMTTAINDPWRNGGQREYITLTHTLFAGLIITRDGWSQGRGNRTCLAFHSPTVWIRVQWKPSHIGQSHARIARVVGQFSIRNEYRVHLLGQLEEDGNRIQIEIWTIPRFGLLWEQGAERNSDI